MHRTVLRHEKTALQRCQSCCSNYHCPFCGPKVFKPITERHVVENHVRNHLSLAVQHGGKLTFFVTLEQCNNVLLIFLACIFH